MLNKTLLDKPRFAFVFIITCAFGFLAPIAIAATPKSILWLNHFALLPGGNELTVSFNSSNSGVGSGLTGLVISSSTTGDTFTTGGGNKDVQMAAEVPPNYTVKKVRVCYEVSSTIPATPSFITQIRLAQVQDPPSSAVVLLDDGTQLTAPGPVCVTSKATTIDPRLGSLLLNLRLNFGNTADKIVIRGIGLQVKSNGS
jgi:hypothetical protein